MTTPSPRHSRRWFALAAAGAAIVPFAAHAQIKGGDSDDDSRNTSDDSYTSPEFGMEVTWEAPWELDDVTEKAAVGFEAITLGLPTSAADYLSIYTSLISENFGSSEEYLDHAETLYDSDAIADARQHTDGVHFLLTERTESSFCIMFFFNTAQGATFELYEHVAEPDAEFATRTILMVNTSEVFEGHFKSAQQYVTLNGDTPFVTLDDDDVIELATDALDGVYPDDSDSRSNRRDDDDDEPVEDDDEPADDQDTDTALAGIRDEYTILEPTVDELIGLITVELSQSQADRANEILGLWLDAPVVAQRTSLPASLADLEEAYVAFADNLEVAANGLFASISADSTDAEAQAGLTDFTDATGAHAALAATLDELLTDAGA